MQEQLVRLDVEREAAFDILLLLADSRAVASEYGRALNLLDQAESAAGVLPADYEMKRLRWLAGSR